MTDWLDDEMARAEREWRDLPVQARPIRVAPLDAVHDENCCMAGVWPGSGPHPDCPGKREAARQFTEDRREMEREYR